MNDKDEWSNVSVADIDTRTTEQKQMDDEDNLKVEINTFVWTHAPHEMTLGKADEMACKIFDLFVEARESFKDAKPTCELPPAS